MSRTGDFDRDTKLTSLRRGVENILGQLDPTGEKGRTQLGAAAAWREVAGAPVAAHATAVYVRGRELVVEMDSPTWAQDVSMFTDRYRDAVNTHLGETVIDSVRIAVHRPKR